MPAAPPPLGRGFNASPHLVPGQHPTQGALLAPFRRERALTGRTQQRFTASARTVVWNAARHAVACGIAGHLGHRCRRAAALARPLLWHAAQRLPLGRASHAPRKTRPCRLHLPSSHQPSGYVEPSSCCSACAPCRRALGKTSSPNTAVAPLERRLREMARIHRAAPEAGTARPVERTPGIPVAVVAWRPEDRAWAPAAAPELRRCRAIPWPRPKGAAPPCAASLSRRARPSVLAPPARALPTRRARRAPRALPSCCA